MLANGQTEDAIFGRQLEAIYGGVVRDLRLLGDGELLELVWLEDRLWLRRCWDGRCRCLGSWWEVLAVVGEDEERVSYRQ